MVMADTWMHGGVGWGWMVLMMILMVLFWAAIIFGIVWLVRTAVGGGPERRSESPIDVLERRFAEGTISEEDYRARREVLLNGSVGSTEARSDRQLAAPRM